MNHSSVCQGTRSIDDNVPSEQSFLLICVKYGGDTETERYLESIRAQENLDALHVLVVDNSADSNWIPNVSQLNCQAVRPTANLGYLVARVTACPDTSNKMSCRHGW